MKNRLRYLGCGFRRVGASVWGMLLALTTCAWANEGDLNGDGQVNGSDLITLIRMLVGLEAPDHGADLNGDGNHDLADVRALIHLVLGHDGDPGNGPHFNECPFGLTKMETQAWWVDSEDDGAPFDDFGHIHAAMCFPLLSSIPPPQLQGGQWHTNVRITLHHNPSRLHSLRFDNQSGDTVEQIEFSPNLTCPIDHTCAWDVPVVLDPSRFASSALRVRATAETSDGKRFLTSSDWPLAGGHTSGPIQGKGWYGPPVDDYGIAQLDPATVPQGPVSGTYTFRVQTKKASDQLTVSLDGSHGVPAAGMWLEEPHTTAQSLAVFNEDVKDWRDIPLDTRALSNGWHILLIKSRSPLGEASRCATCDDDVDHLHGALRLWFEVRN